MTYSHIDKLNKLIKLCIDNKIEYSFKRILTSSIRHYKLALKRNLFKQTLKLIKTSLKNNDIEQAFKNLFTTPIQLVSTYYYKKLNVTDPNTNAQTYDENQCAGIIIFINNKFLAIPSSSYTLLLNTQRERSRLQNNTSILKKTKNILTNPIKTIFHNNTSLKDIVNYGRDTEKAIYDYLLHSSKNIKEFNDFYQANKYLKNFTSAQYIKVESTFSYLENQDTKAKETSLLLIIKLSNRNKVYYAIETFIKENKDNIIEYTNTEIQLNKVK